MGVLLSVCPPGSCHPIPVGSVPLASSGASWDRPLGELWASLMLCLEPWTVQKPLGKAKCPPLFSDLT